MKINNFPHKHVSTADGTQKDVQGVVDLPIIVENSCQILKALVVPSLPHAFIFGVDFAKQFKIKIDFKDKTWHVQSGSTSLNVLEDV